MNLLAFAVTSFACATTVLALAACGSDGSSSTLGQDAAAGPLGPSSSGPTPSCDVLSNGTDPQGCAGKYCQCSDGYATANGALMQRTATTCTVTIDCAAVCADHGGGTEQPVADVYASGECGAYCRKIASLPCASANPNLFDLDIETHCAIPPVVGSDGGTVTPGTPSAACVDARKQVLRCYADKVSWACSDAGSGWGAATTVCSAELSAQRTACGGS